MKISNSINGIIQFFLHGNRGIAASGRSVKEENLLKTRLKIYILRTVYAPAILLPRFLKAPAQLIIDWYLIVIAVHMLYSIALQI